jgi:hypothetical protein
MIIINVMDTTGSLLLLGNYLNNNNDKEEVDSNALQMNNKTKHYMKNRLSGDNIYHSRQSDKIDKYITAKAKKRYAKSKKPHKTGIVSNNYNNIETFDEDSEFSDDGSSYCSTGRSNSPVNISDHTALFEHSNKITDNTKRSDFLEQFNELSFDHQRSPHAKNSSDRLSIERDIALKGEYSKFEKQSNMDYNVVSGDDFTHINMVPFFSGNAVGYGTTKEEQKKIDSTKQRKLDLFTGSSNSLDYRPKTERRPLFNPIVGLSNPYGMPNVTEFMSSRYIPSKERRNEFPVSQVKVTPGLNLGYNEVAKQGYHDTWRPTYKNVDQLRTANNPKVSYGNVVIPGMKGFNRATIPNMVNRTAPRFKENDPKDMLKSLGYYRAPAVRENFNVSETNRAQNSRAYVGPIAASKDAIRPESMLEKVRISKKQNFEETEPRNIGTSKMNKNKMVNYNDIPNTTKKELGIINKRVGQIGTSQFSAQKAFNYNDIPDPTLREQIIKSVRSGQIDTSQLNRSQGFNYNDIPDPTLRELFVQCVRSGLIGTSQLNKAQGFNYNDVPQTTLRDMNACTDRAGNVNTTQLRKAPGFNYNDSPQVTMKDMLINADRSGNVNTTQLRKGTGFNYNDAPQTTLKDMLINADRSGNVNTTQFRKGQGFNYNDAPQTTLKDMSINVDRSGNVNTTQFRKGQGFNYNDTPQTTLKDMTINVDRSGNVNTTQFRKGQGFNYNDTPQITLKDMTINVDRTGNINTSQLHKKPGFNYKDVPETTLREMFINSDRTGNINTTQLHKKPGFNYKDVPETTLREMFINSDRAGNINTSQLHKKPGFNYKDVPKTTLKDMTINTDRSGNVGSSQLHKTQGFNYKDVPGTTLKEMTINADRAGNIGHTGTDKGGYTVAHQMTTAKTTLRQLTQDNKYINPIGGSNEKEKGGYTIAHQTTTAKTTLRQLTQNNNYINPVGDNEKQTSRADANASQINITKERILKGRSPTVSNYTKGPTLAFTTVSLCKPIQIDRELYPNMQYTNTNEHLPILHTQLNVPLPSFGDRSTNTHIKDNLKNNPFINNTIHKSVLV